MSEILAPAAKNPVGRPPGDRHARIPSYVKESAAKTLRAYARHARIPAVAALELAISRLPIVPAEG